MELDIIKDEEKRMNQIMFLFYVAIPIEATLFVILFNHGGARDSVALLMIPCGVMVHLNRERIGKYAKYLYISILPLLGVVIIIAATPGAFGAMAMAYFLVLFLSIPYYDLDVVKFCAVITVVPNALGMLLFSKSYFALHNLCIWVFILLVYLIGVVVAF